MSAAITWQLILSLIHLCQGRTKLPARRLLNRQYSNYLRKSLNQVNEFKEEILEQYDRLLLGSEVSTKVFTNRSFLKSDEIIKSSIYNVGLMPNDHEVVGQYAKADLVLMKRIGSKILGYEREKFKPQEFLEIKFTKAPLDEVDNPYGLDKRFVTYEAPNGFAYWTDFPYGGYGKYSERTFLDILKAIDAARHIPIYAPTKKNN